MYILSYSIRYLTTTIFLLFPCLSYSSSPIDDMKDSLNIYAEEDFYIRYTKYLDRNYFEVKKYYKNANPNQRALEIFDKYKLYRAPKSSIEILRARRYYYLYSYTYKKVYGMDDTYYDLLSAASELVENEKMLDKYAFKIEFQIGHYFATKNDYDKALQYYYTTLDGIKERKEFGNLSRVLGDIANIYKWKKEYIKAEKYLRLSEEYAISSNNDKAIRAGSVKLRSYYLDVGDTSNFIRYYHKSNVAIEKVNKPDKSIYLSQSYQEYARYLSESNQYAHSNQYLLRADSTLNSLMSNRNRREFAKLDLSMASNYYLMGDYELARRYIQLAYSKLIPSYNKTQSLPNTSQIYDENTIVDLLELQSKIYYSQYNKSSDDRYLDSVLQVILKAVDSNEKLRKLMVYSKSKVLSTSINRSLINRALDVFHLKHLSTGLTHHDWMVLRRLIDQSKNALLTEQLNMNRSIQLLNRIDRQRIDSLQNDIIFLIHKKAKVANTDSLDIVINNNKEEISEFFTSTNKLNVDLKPATNFIEYIVTDSLVYLVTDVSTEERFFKLGSRAELVTLIDRMHEQLESRTGIELINQTLFELYEYLFPSSIVLQSEIIIIPDDVISFIPFDALYDGTNYLLIEHEIYIKYHNLLEELNSKIEYESIYCVSPEYKGSSDSSLIDRGSVYHLQSAKQEVQYILANTNWTSISSNNISYDSLFKNLAEVDIFHFAGHAVANSNSAYLILNNGENYEKLYHDQILNKSVSSKLVTLSACESGLGEVQYGDGINSLSRSFLGAGAKDITYSLWNVNDQTTTEIMKEYYYFITNGFTPNESLRRSKIKYLEENPNEKIHPYYWAAFVSTNQLFSRKNSSDIKLFVLLGVLVTLLYLFLKNRKI